MMNRSISHLCLLLALSPACGAAPEKAELPAAAAGQPGEPSQAQARLAELRNRIAAVTRRLHGELQERDVRSARLREADLGIAGARRRLEDLRSAELSALRRRGELRAEQTRTQAELDAGRVQLAAQLRAAYVIGRQEPIKLLLNQNDPAAAGRMVTLYGFFARDRARKMAQIAERVARVRDLVGRIDRTTAALQALRGDAGREMSGLQQARAERAAALAAVAQQVSSGTEELARLKREEQAEEALVADLARMLADLPLDSRDDFAQLRGRLPWPVPGRMTAAHRGGAGAAPGLRWNGVLIETARGARVRAPCVGRVVYADWLQGLGLLLIIGHKGNYLTLYGHAEVLYKSVGDWVAPGDVIAGLAETGSAAPQLYFEIREGRTPKDPTLWLKKTP